MSPTTHLRRWRAPIAGVLLTGGLATLPLLGGCAGVETANAADATLERFTGCSALNDHARREAMERVGPYGLDGGMVAFAAGTTLALEDASAAAPSAGQARAAGTDFSTTNVQEAGVDEPDIVKTDGTRIFALARNRLYAVDASGPAPRVAGSIALPTDVFGRDMLLAGTTLVVLGDGAGQVRPAAGPAASDRVAGAASLAYPGPSGATLLKVDVADASAMRIVETFETEARYVNARLTGTTARVVVASGAPLGVAFTSPVQPGAAEEDAARRANRSALARTSADNWIPRYRVTTGAGPGETQPLTACDAVSRPRTFSGLGTLTVLTIDMAGGLDPVDADAVMASGENVYASPESLYVATNRWPVPGPDGTVPDQSVTTTEVHKFDIAGGPVTEYRGSGTVIGTLLNQFSMSEHEGVLRVATTDAGQMLVGGDAVVGDGASESYVTTLRDTGGRLAQVGQVGGLGRNEQIYAVRFIGPTGYVVTFRRTDPLYTVDLSDPARPRVTGELKIAGYSAYLHPAGEGLLIGVGQDATGEGRTTGLQVSLFDVSDPAAPRRLHNRVLRGANSDAEWDHRAFLWWPATQLAVVPYQQALMPEVQQVPGGTGVAPDILPMRMDTGAIGMRVSRDGIDEAGRVTHPVDPMTGAGIRRSLVIGDALYTVSDAGVRQSSLDDLAERAWVAFG